MDIFSRIDNHDNDKQQPQAADTKSKQEFYLGVDGYKICEVEYHDDYRNNPEKYGYVGVPKTNEKKNRKLQKNAEKLYKILSSPYKEYYSYVKHLKEVERREKKVEKLLKKGVDTTFLSARTLGLVVDDMSYNIRYMLTTYGFDMWSAIKNSYKYEEHLGENIYFCLKDKDFDNVEVLQNISPMTLECVLNTRKQLDISKQTVVVMVTYVTSCKNENLLKNLNLLLKYGQISLEKDQIKELSDYLFIKDTYMQTKAPEITRLCAQVQCVAPTQIKDVCEKYTTQKNIKSSKNDKNKKSEIQEQIDKLFEDAQKSAS